MPLCQKLIKNLTNKLGAELRLKRNPMGRAFEYRKATKLKRWGHMARTFTKLGKEIAIAVKAGGPEPEITHAYVLL